MVPRHLMDAPATEAEALLTTLRGIDPEDDVAFTTAVQQSLLFLKVTDHEFAEEVRTSRPTVTRWKSGESFPHPALRPTVYRLLQTRLEAFRAR